MNFSTIRLQVFLARCGLGSRRYCETFIRQGRVAVNGKIAIIGTKITNQDQVTIDGKLMKSEQPKIYLAVNKPIGYLCANSDPEGRPLVGQLFKKNYTVRLFHVGRLDIRSSGLIFYTNDGRFTDIITHPSYEIEKDYFVKTQGCIPEELLEQYIKGVTLDQDLFRLKRAVRKAENKVVLTLSEGKNREIRRLFDHYRITIRQINRIRIGCVGLKEIPRGGYRHLTREEVLWFLSKEKKIIHEGE